MPLIAVLAIALLAAWLWEKHPGIVIGCSIFICGLVAILMKALGDDLKESRARSEERRNKFRERLDVVDGVPAARVDFGHGLRCALALSGDGARVIYLENPDDELFVLERGDIHSVEVINETFRQETGQVGGSASGVSVSVGGIGVGTGGGTMTYSSTGIDKCHRLSLIFHLTDYKRPILEFLLIGGAPGIVGWSKHDDYYIERYQTAKEWESIVGRMIKDANHVQRTSDGSDA